MNGRKKELPPKKDPNLINEAKRKQSTQTHVEEKKRFTAIYAITLSIGIISLILLALGFAKEPSEKNNASFFERITSNIISRSFMELSNEEAPTDAGSNDFYDSVLDILNGILIPSQDKDDSDTTLVPGDDPPKVQGSIYDFDASKVPDGETPIIPMDLSLTSNGKDYIYNSSERKPNTGSLLGSKLDFLSHAQGAASGDPLVLIVHTHGTEGFCEDGAISYLDDGRELARTEDTAKNVVAVGDVIAKTLADNGINALHCTIMHDKLQYKDSYKRSEETIKEYLEKYPTIKLVIDVHRDSIVKSTGELVRPVAEINGEAAAQVMCVVGASDECAYWQNNLSLALKLRDALNSKYGSICRPPYLRSSTYNQDLTPYSLLLEMGASGNSLPEAKRSAKLVAEEIANLLNQI